MLEARVVVPLNVFVPPVSECRNPQLQVAHLSLQIAVPDLTNDLGVK